MAKVVHFLVNLMVLNPTLNHIPVASHSHNVTSIEYTSPWLGFELTALSAIYTGCTCSCKSNYRIITTTTAPLTFDLKPNTTDVFRATWPTSISWYSCDFFESDNKQKPIQCIFWLFIQTGVKCCLLLKIKILSNLTIFSTFYSQNMNIIRPLHRKKTLNIS